MVVWFCKADAREDAKDEARSSGINLYGCQAPLGSYESFYVFRASEYPFNRILEPGLCSNHYLVVFLSRVPFSALVEREANGKLGILESLYSTCLFDPSCGPRSQPKKKKKIKRKNKQLEHTPRSGTGNEM